MAVAEKTFDKRTIPVDGRHFDRCRFDDCVLEFAGGKQPRFEGCDFFRCKWLLCGPAANTVLFMQGLHGNGVVDIVSSYFSPDITIL